MPVPCRKGTFGGGQRLPPSSGDVYDEHVVYVTPKTAAAATADVSHPPLLDPHAHDENEYAYVDECTFSHTTNKGGRM